jgi:hypothetical protein
VLARTALALLALGLGVGKASPPPPAPLLRIHCTPETIEQQGKGKGPQKSRNPIADALSKAKPGAVIELDPGVYPPFTIGFQSNSPANAVTSGGTEGNPVVVVGAAGGVRIQGAEGDTIAIDQKVENGWITFRNLEIIPGRRAGIMFYQRGDGRVHRGYSFEDCHILGDFDPDTGQGKRSKWGVWGNMMADFRFVGVTEPARIENISEEHAFYIQNPQGPITIENVHAKDIGRTFCQFTARGGDGPPGIGDVTVRKCVVEDAGISQADGFKGGSAFTIAGRLQGTLLFEENVYRAGFRAERRRMTTPGLPYGTGAFMAWEADRAGANGILVLRDNRFEMAKGCGDRALVSIGGCEKVLVLGENKFVSGGKQPALVLDPLNGQGRPVSKPNGSVYVAPATVLGGELRIGNEAPTDEQLAELRREKKGEPAPPASAPDGGAGGH